ncbi:MAG: hypothetical protein ACREHE_10380 [Rhizomicrobium sp.]
MDALAQALAASPALFPHNLDVDKGTISLVEMDGAAYRAASFLDARILSPKTVSRVVPWSAVETATAGLPEACDFIFHIGHVGSTLLSRLMGAHPAVFALREPLALRTLAQMRIDGRGDPMAYLPTLLKLWSRTFHPGQRAIVKATSFASEFAPDILAQPYCPKAIFMAVTAETYLASILAGPNSRQEARMLGATRYARLSKRVGKPVPQPASEGELIAMSWACEMGALDAANAQDRVLHLDFDQFLADPQSALAACFNHSGIAATDGEIGAILSGHDMRTYSKAQEYDYDTKLRRDVLDQARRQHGAQIGRGLVWLEKMGLPSDKGGSSPPTR